MTATFVIVQPCESCGRQRRCELVWIDDLVFAICPECAA